MSKYQLIEPGVDPTDEPNTPRRRTGMLFWIAGAGLAVVIICGIIFKPNQAQAASDPTSTPTVASSFTPSPTTTSTARALIGDVTMPPTATYRPTASPSPAATQTPWIKIEYRDRVMVTVQVVTVDIPVQQTVIITGTPMPTYTSEPTQTPWLITVEVTSTPTETPVTPSPTPTETPTMTETITFDDKAITPGVVITIEPPRPPDQ